MWHRFLDFVSSLKLTIVCLAAAIILVFAGTLAQVHFGTHVVQERYFQSLFIWWPAESHGFRIPVFPGGHLLGALLLVNLFAAHLRRFRLSLGNLGMHLIHGGLIIMLAGGLFTDLLSVESHLQIAPGETKNYSEDSQRVELALIDQGNSDADRIVAIPEAVLRRGGTVNLSGIPFRVEIKHFYANSQIQMIAPGTNAARAADHGVGAQISVQELPQATAVDARDLRSVVIELVPTGEKAASGSLGTWLVSEGLGAPQTFSFAGGPWRLEMRPVRYYKPYSLTLQKFTHECYPGTEIPKNFASQITLNDPGQGVHREVLIYMNHPFRYQGETYYQSGFGQDDQSSILQVVHNPSFVAPYIACAIISFGMLIQFCQHFVRFTRRAKVPRAK